MAKNPQVIKMSRFSDSELLKILDEWSKYHRDSVEAALILAEQRGLEIDTYKNKIDFPQKQLGSSINSKILNLALWFLVANQIIGGLTGLTIVDYSSREHLFLVLPLMLFSIVCGALLIWRSQLSLILAGVNFLLQAFIVQVGFDLGFKYFTGVHFGIEIIGYTISFFAEMGAGVRFGQLSSESSIIIGINVLSIVALVVLYHYWRNVENKST